MRAFLTDDRRRDHVPAEVLRQLVRRDFALVERAAWEVAQRNLTATGLVHAIAARPVFSDQQRRERVVGAPGDQLDRFDGAMFQERERILRERGSLGHEQRRCHGSANCRAAARRSFPISLVSNTPRAALLIARLRQNDGSSSKPGGNFARGGLRHDSLYDLWLVIASSARVNHAWEAA